jgi:hypothetical protein
MKKTTLAAIAASICSSCFAQTSDQRCVVNRPRANNGATVAAQMLVVNDGNPCDMRVRFRGQPATSLVIHAKPSSGTLEQQGSKVSYTPRPGFAGKDAFDVQWFGMGWGPYISEKNVRTKVEVTVRAKDAEESSVEAAQPDAE